MRQYYRRPSLFWPFLLVAIGIIFLLNNLGIMPGTFWDVVLRFWPVLLILIGLDSIYRGEGFAGAAFITGLGIIFLLINLGYMGWSIWDILIRFWPVFLILLGVDIIFSRYRGSVWASLAALVIMIAIVGGVVFLARTQAVPGANLTSEAVQQPLGGAKQANVQVSIAIGGLTLQPMSDPSQFVKGTVHLAPGERWNDTFSNKNQAITYAIQSEGAGSYVSFGRSSDQTFELALNTTPMTDLTVNIGAGNCDITTTGMKLSRLKVNTGIGRCTIQIPAATNYQVEIKGAIGETVLVLPANQAARIHLDNGIAGLQYPQGFHREGDTLLTPGYSDTADHIEIEVGEAIGNLRIQTAAQ